MQDQIPHIVYISPEFYSKGEIEKDLEVLKGTDLNIYVQQNENNPLFNAFEWIIPSAFGVYILKPYFDSILSEVGKDHYELLKKFISQYLKKGKKFNFSLIAAKESSKKLSKTYNNSLTVALEIQAKNNRVIKILFDNSLSIEEWQEASSKIMDLFVEHYRKSPEDVLTKAMNRFEDKPHRKLYIIINKRFQNIEIKDDNDLVEIYKK
jgi:hypothetical protein